MSEFNEYKPVDLIEESKSMPLDELETLIHSAIESGGKVAVNSDVFDMDDFLSDMELDERMVRGLLHGNYKTLAQNIDKQLVGYSEKVARLAVRLSGGYRPKQEY